MSSIVRVYNIFTQIKNNLDGENNILGQELLKKVFKVESDEDLNYLKSYIFKEIDNCEAEMRAENLGDDEISRVITPFQKYMQNELFNPLAVLDSHISRDSFHPVLTKDIISKFSCEFIKQQFPVRAMEDITRDAKPLLKNFGKYTNEKEEVKGYEEKVEEIKDDVASLKDKFLQLNKADDYVCSFILLNLDRIDILLNNFDKIAPKYIEFNLYAIVTPVYVIDEYKELREDMKSLWDNITGFIDTHLNRAATIYTFAPLIINNLPTLP